MTTHKVAIITGASRGIGAGLVAGYRRRDWAVVASARTIKPSQDPDLLTVAGDIAEPATAGRIADAALERFGRIDTLVNSAGVFISKPPARSCTSTAARSPVTVAPSARPADRPARAAPARRAVRGGCRCRAW